MIARPSGSLAARPTRRFRRAGQRLPIAARWLSGLLAALLLLTGLQPGVRPAAVQAQTPAPASVLTFGALLNLSQTGDIDTQAAVRMAVEEVNDYLAAGGSTVQVQLQVEGTRLDPAAARAKLAALADRGISVVIGPESSGELEAIKPFADEHGLVLISHCSTAPSLAIPDDAIFRLVPDDNRQAEALARLMADDGVKAIVPIWRGDVFGDDLSAATKRSFEQLGGVVLEGIRYDPDGTSFTPEVETLAQKVAQAVARFGQGAVAVHLLAFGPDSVPILHDAAQRPALAGVKWYGSDGTVESREILEDEQASHFAAQTSFASSLFAEADSKKTALVKARIREQVGSSPHVCALAAYDAVWLAALNALAAPAGDSAAFARVFPQTASAYFGASGWTALNAAGDRDAADYDFWTIKEAEGTFRWGRVAKYVSTGAGGRIVR